MKRVILLITLLCYMHHLNAQSPYSLKGVVKDSTGEIIVAANILIITSQDTLHTISDEIGKFEFLNLKSRDFIIKISLLGFETWQRQYNISSDLSEFFIPEIKLKPKTNLLHEIIVTGKKQAIVLKKDTLEYNIDQLRLRENSVVGDILKRLPGLQVDLNGNIKFMGKPITGLKINGQEIAVNNIETLISIFPAEEIDKIQLIDDYGEMARLTGRKTGIPGHILNLKTKKDIQKTNILQAIIGKGNEDKYDLSLTSVNKNPRHHLNFFGSSRNTDATTGTRTQHNLSSSYMTKIKNLDIKMNVNRSKAKQSESSGSLFKTITGEGQLVNNSENNSISTSENYGIYLNTEYRSQTNNYMSMVLRSYVNNDHASNITNSKQTGLQYLDLLTNNKINSKNSMIDNAIHMSHPFKKKGRILTTGISFNYIKNDASNDNHNKLTYYQGSLPTYDSIYHQLMNNSTNSFASLITSSFIEPLDSVSDIEFRGSFNNSFNKYQLANFMQNKDEHFVLIDTLSNNFRYNTAHQEIGFNYKHTGKRLEYIVGGSFRMYEIINMDKNENNVRISGNFLQPYLRLQLSPNNFSSLSVSNISEISYPTFQQIQPVPDRTNVQIPIIGNPYLKPSTNLGITLGYRYTKKSLLFATISGSITKNKIISNTILINDTLNSVIQEIHFLNASGNYSFEATYGWSKPFNGGKYQVSVEGNSILNNTPIYINNVKSESRNLTTTQSVNGSIFQDWVEITANINYTLHNNLYNINGNNEIIFQTWNLSLIGKIIFLKSWSLSFNSNKQFNAGLNNISNPLIFNAILEKKLLKNKLAARMQGFNIFNEYSGVSQSISANTISEIHSKLAGRFFLLSLVLNLKRIETK